MQPNEIKANLKAKIAEAKELSAYHKREWDKDPEDFGLRLRFNTFKTIIEDLENQLEAHEAFERGWELFNKDKRIGAKKEFLKSIELMPSYLGFLNNQLGLNAANDWQLMVFFMKFLLEIAPNYNLAKENLVIAYINYGIEQAKQGSTINAIEQFNLARQVANNDKLRDLVSQNIVAAYTQLGIKTDQQGNLKEAAEHMLNAFSCLENDTTNYNAKRALERLVLYYMEKALFKEALEVFEKLKHLFGLSPELTNDYAITLVTLNRTQEAITILENLLEGKFNLSENTLSCIQDNLLIIKQQHNISFENKRLLSPRVLPENKINLPVPKLNPTNILQFQQAA